MTVTVQFMKSPLSTHDAVVIPVIDGKVKLEKGVLPTAAQKQVKAIVAEKGRFEKPLSVESFSIMDGDKLVWVVMVALDKKPSSLMLERAGAAVMPALKQAKVKSPVVVPGLCAEDMARFANGVVLRSYEFNRYKTKNVTDVKITLRCVTEHKANADVAYKACAVVTQSVFKARDLVNTPPNDLYPQSYADEIKGMMKGSGVKVTVFDEKKLTKMGAGALMAVGEGSSRQPRLVVMEYDGRTKKTKGEKPFALIGKGVTFDTGGYSLKPGASMLTMKMDMGGSAAVVGAMRALAVNKEPVYVVAAVALAENMIDGTAYRVDDVVTSLSGQTIEVGNTDAEGRLCLADAMTYIQNEYDPKVMVDVATLTGACMVALGTEMAGVFSNVKGLESFFWQSGDVTGDDFWPLPVNDDFNKCMNSDIADMSNLGSNGRFGGASTAAAFLRRFVTNDRPWAHLDIAGTAWRKDDKNTNVKGATGFGVRALYEFVTRGESALNG